MGTVRAFPDPDDPADRVGASLADHGLKHLFGVPGGGHSSDVIVAADARGARFVLTQTETGAALMAAAQGEITGRAGACVTTLGPGVTSAVNGVTHARLDRAAMVVFADAPPDPADDVGIHQRVDQRAVLAPVTKGQVLVGREHVEASMARAFELAEASPPGPVYVELGFRRAATDEPEPSVARPDTADEDGHPAGDTAWGELRPMIAAARRPVILVGLEVRSPEDIAAVREFCRDHDVPALVTYKAKGVIPDSSPQFAGLLTNGAIEASILEESDLLIGVGLDPIELLARRWPYSTPIIDISPIHHPGGQLPVSGRMRLGPVDGLRRVASALGATEGAARAHADGYDSRRRLAALGSGRLTSTTALAELAAHWSSGARVTVDAGAHMLPAMLLWPAMAKSDLLISNGLSTMGFALPAAIGAALLEPGRRIVAITGDGGLLMCLGELATLARENLDVCVVVFDDRALSLIKLKQEQRGATVGVELGSIDWVAMAASMGIRGFAVETLDALGSCLAQIDSSSEPSLLAIRIESTDYVPVLRAIRG
jgi:Thiamine pyrophosphate-requiring enzymes [acetolactate synthase, pyruvate dehydrogenase (cytochrome), glyoxylate carboligase, phosphonopyruvate decarboxylase]